MFITNYETFLVSRVFCCSMLKGRGTIEILNSNTLMPSAHARVTFFIDQFRTVINSMSIFKTVLNSMSIIKSPVFRIRIILMRIRIRGSASGMMDPDSGPVLDTDPDPT